MKNAGRVLKNNYMALGNWKKMTRKELLKDVEAMEKIMDRTAERCDIWQDRFIYAMAKAIYHILLHIIRKEEA